jgi:hypothetical protein
MNWYEHALTHHCYSSPPLRLHKHYFQILNFKGRKAVHDWAVREPVRMHPLVSYLDTTAQLRVPNIRKRKGEGEERVSLLIHPEK